MQEFLSRCKKRLFVWLFLALAFGPGQLHAQRPLGIDVSDYQLGINWPNVKNAGITFAWCKATEGLTVNDTSYVYDMTNGKAAGVYVGSYHFGHPELHPDAAGADQEADHFWSVAGNYITNGGFYLMPVLDVEKFTNSMGYMSDWANEWCNRIVGYARSNGVTITPLIYISSSHAQEWYLNTVTNWPVWIAEWPFTPNPQTGAPSSYIPWPGWKVWQYADHGNIAGIPNTNFDLDVFNGTIDTLISTIVIDGTNTPPAITSNPSSRSADRGKSLTMRVVAAGSPTLKYQWYRNGSPLGSGTGSTLTFPNVTTNNAGSYTVVVTNSLASVTSSVAVVTVNGLYGQVFGDNFDTDTSASWRVNKTTDTRTIFAYDYSVIGIPSAPNSSGGSTKGLRMEANIAAGAVNAQSVSPLGQNFTGNYRLHFDMWINVNGPLPGGGTGSTEAVTAGVGTTGDQVQWTSAANGVWFAADGDGDLADTSTTFNDFNAYVGTTVQSVGSGVYTAGTQSTARGNGDVYYANVFPSGQNPPNFQRTNFTQQSGYMNVGTLALAWHDVIINKNGGTVDWFMDGLKIASAPSASANSTNIFVGYWDPFSSVSDNTNLSFGLIDNLRVEVPAVAPVIAANPVDFTVSQTSNAFFSVSASGIPTPSYQWRYNGGTLTGATNSSYVLTNAQYYNAGSYSVVVTNVAGTVTSTNALLTVIVQPGITAPPTNLTANIGANATFSVQATGTSPAYQWLKNGGGISGATGTSLALTNISQTDAASYSVIVSNSAAAITSANAVLNLVTMKFNSPQMVVDGSGFQLNVTGAPGIYQLDRSSNLVNWTSIVTLTNQNGTLQFKDPSVTNTGNPRLFYRISSPK